jgi:2-desacetyl-2-hydroxyethyl bacteriochlorophyllide A dehydrogenase
VRAAVFRGADRGLVIEERPDLTPGAGQVLLRIGRSGICGSDLHMTSGHGAFQLPEGIVVGHEYAGAVVELGPGVTQLRVGDRVAPLPSGGCGACAACQQGTPTWCTGDKPPPRFGGYAEYAVADESGSAVLPDSVTDAEGALVEPLAVGLHGVHLAQIEPGAKVLVLGAGPIGVAAVFWLKRMGASQVVVSATSRRREPFVSAVGADGLIAGEDDLTAAATEALGGPPDVVVEAAGVPGTIEAAIKAVRRRGTVLVLGMLTEPDSFLPVTPLMKQVRLQFSMTYGIRDFRFVADTLGRGALEARAMITETVSFNELPAMFESLRGPNPHCKVLIDPTR